MGQEAGDELWHDGPISHNCRTAFLKGIESSKGTKADTPRPRPTSRLADRPLGRAAVSPLHGNNVHRQPQVIQALDHVPLRNEENGLAIVALRRMHDKPMELAQKSSDSRFRHRDRLAISFRVSARALTAPDGLGSYLTFAWPLCDGSHHAGKSRCLKDGGQPLQRRCHSPLDGGCRAANCAGSTMEAAAPVIGSE